MADHLSYRTEKLPKKDPRKVIADGAPVIPPGQKYGLIGVIEDKKNNKFGICLIGAVNTMEEAKHYIKENRKRGFIYLDIFIITLGPIAAFPPPKDPKDITFHQDALQEVLGSHFKREEEAAEALETRLEQEKDAERVHKAIREKIAERSEGAASLVTRNEPPPGAIVTKPIRLELRPRKEEEEEEPSRSVSVKDKCLEVEGKSGKDQKRKKKKKRS